jgi:hypothetical protein
MKVRTRWIIGAGTVVSGVMAIWFYNDWSYFKKKNLKVGKKILSSKEEKTK